MVNTAMGRFISLLWNLKNIFLSGKLQSITKKFQTSSTGNLRGI